MEANFALPSATGTSSLSVGVIDDNLRGYFHTQKMKFLAIPLILCVANCHTSFSSPSSNGIFPTVVSTGAEIETSDGHSRSSFTRTKNFMLRRKNSDKTPPFKNAQNKVPSVLNVRGGSISLLIPNNLPLPALKMLIQASLSIFNVLCWYIPMKSKNFTSNAEILSLANCLAGGIFIMLSFGHLIPEAVTMFQDHLPSDKAHEAVKYAMQYSIVGFLAMVFIGKVAFDHSEDDSTVPVPDSSVEKRGRFSLPKPNSAIMLCFAMSFHSFFEAAALGVAPDRTSALIMASSIGLHQPAESIALLIALLKQLKPSSENSAVSEAAATVGGGGNMSHSAILSWLAAFSCVGMIGVTTGCLIQQQAGGSQLEAIVVAITAGTFIFASATEITSEEFEGIGLKQKLSRFAAYVAGIGLIALTAAIGGE